MSAGPFYVVRHRREVKVGRRKVQRAYTYSIYLEDKQFLRPPAREKLSRREAYWIARLLNDRRHP